MSDRTNADDIPLRDAGRGSGDGSARHHRAPLPVDRSILWTPSRDPGAPEGPAATGPYELFLTLSVLQDVSRALPSDGQDSRFGFLLGHLYRCPETGVHYAVADRTLHSDERFDEETPDPFLLRAWAGFQEAHRDHGGVLLGWYHSHYMLGLFLSEADREINARYFAEPWQCCLLVVPDPSRPMGAVYRPSLVQESGGEEPGPFRELLAPEDVPASGPIMSAVGWTNYFADREIVAIPEDTDFAPTEAPAAVAIEGDASASATGLVLPTNPTTRHRFPLGRRRLLRLAAILAVVIGAYFGGKALFQSPAPPPDPVDTTPPVPQVPPEVQRFQDATADLQEAMLGYAERRQDFDLGRIGCELLAGGYAAADDAFIGMAAAFAGLGASVDEARETEYERLVEEMNVINEHFDASACPRPQ